MTGKTDPNKAATRFRLVSIPEHEIELSFARSGGPGGQNVNKVETKVTVCFDFVASKVLSWEEKGRLGRSPLILQHLNSEGALSITCQTHRSQALNREEAIKKLNELINRALRPKRKRIPTKRTKSSERERLQTKKVRSQAKFARRKISPHSDG